VRHFARTCWILVLLFATAPGFAGTLYLPIVAPEEPSEGSYKVRVWFTNNGDHQVDVRLLFLPGMGDGTKNRSGAEVKAIGPGATLVLFEVAEPGLLEIEAPPEVAVNAELRHTTLPGPKEVFGASPVVWSENVADPGETLVVQGLRRNAAGVATHLGLMNLGHKAASCYAGLFRTDGGELASASALPLPALANVLLEDVLVLVETGPIGDVHARISCDRPFYAYAALQERTTGEIVFVEPSPTGTSTLKPPGQQEPEEPPSGSFVFKRSGTFHVPSPQRPTDVFTIQAPKNRVFRKVVLDMDFTQGGWYAKEPDKNHSLFWLHRGGCCWPAWKQNILGFVNAFGPKKNNVKVTHNMDYVGKTQYDTSVYFTKGFALQPGKSYHLRYEYDAGGGQIRLTLTQGGGAVLQMTSKTTTSRIHSGASGQFMAYFGHEDASGTGHGPERPTYNWKYSNLRVEFIP
jgi:hypothetical protein